MTKKLIMESCRDCTGTQAWKFSSPKGGNLTIADIHNFLAKTFGGGVYLVVINANDGRLVDKISVVDAYDACVIECFYKGGTEHDKQRKTGYASMAPAQMGKSH